MSYVSADPHPYVQRFIDFLLGWIEDSVKNRAHIIFHARER